MPYPDEFDSINDKLYQDENGQEVTLTSDRLDMAPGRAMLSAEALQAAMLCMARELERSDMTNVYTADEIQSAIATLGDILVQRGCAELACNGHDHLTALIDTVVYG